MTYNRTFLMLQIMEFKVSRKRKKIAFNFKISLSFLQIKLGIR